MFAAAHAGPALPSSTTRGALRPSLPAPLPQVGQQVLVRFDARTAALGQVEEVNPAPIGGLVTVAIAAVDRATGSRSSVSMTVPGWVLAPVPD